LGGLLEQELWTGGAQHVPEMPEGRGDVSVVERARVAEFAAERQLVAAEQQQELEETELEEMEEEAEEEDVEGLLLRIQRAAGPLSRWPAWALAMVRATQLESCHEVLVLGIFMCTRSPSLPLPCHPTLCAGRREQTAAAASQTSAEITGPEN
jgi:hypothetical protein